MKLNYTTTASVVAAILLSQVVGCALFRSAAPTDTPHTASNCVGSFSQSDLIEMANEIAKLILSHPFPPASSAPKITIFDIADNTELGLDMTAVETALMTVLSENSRLTFINTNQRDALLKHMDIIESNAPSKDDAERHMGRRLDARYVLRATITKIEKPLGLEARAAKGEGIYYQLTAIITDTDTGLIVLRKQCDRLRSPAPSNATKTNLPPEK